MKRFSAVCLGLWLLLPPISTASGQQTVLNTEPVVNAVRTEAQWRGFLKQWRKNLEGREGARLEELEADIAAIREVTDPAALRPLTEIVRQDKFPVPRLLCLEQIAAIDTPEAVETLVLVSVVADQRNLRAVAAQAIGRSQHRQHALDQYIKHLRVSPLRNACGEALLASGILPEASTSQKPDKKLFLALVDALHSDSRVVVKTYSGWKSPRTHHTTTQVVGRLTTLPILIENPAILKSLTSVTGHDATYNDSEWRNWYMEQ